MVITSLKILSTFLVFSKADLGPKNTPTIISNVVSAAFAFDSESIIKHCDNKHTQNKNKWGGTLDLQQQAFDSCRTAPLNMPLEYLED